MVLSEGYRKLKSRVALFLVLPFSVGTFGLMMSYLKSKVFKQNGATINFDSDFVIPFLLTFVIVVVIMIQTEGFTSKAKGVVVWPKMKRKKNIVRKTVVVDDDGNEIKDEKILKMLEDKIKAAEKNKKEE